MDFQDFNIPQNFTKPALFKKGLFFLSPNNFENVSKAKNQLTFFIAMLLGLVAMQINHKENFSSAKTRGPAFYLIIFILRSKSSLLSLHITFLYQRKGRIRYNGMVLFGTFFFMAIIWFLCI